MDYVKCSINNRNIFLVDMKKSDDYIFSELSYFWIKKYIRRNKKVLIIVSKKSYYTGLVCKDCGYIPKCNNCDVPIAYHKLKNGEFIGLCHICKNTYNLYINCPNCWWSNLKFYGVWWEQIVDYISSEFWKKAIFLHSEKINSLKKIDNILSAIKNSDVLIWTSLIIWWLKKYIFRPDLVIFQNADVWINIPDYTSNYKNFLFLYEWINNIDSKYFIIQTYNIEYPHIRYICKNDFDWFKKFELEYRKKYNYPPFSQMAVIMYKHEIEEKLFDKVNKLFKEILYLKEKYWFDNIDIYSSPPLIYKMFWKYRYNIILKWLNVRQFLELIYEKLNIYSRWFKMDWMPQDIV